MNCDARPRNRDDRLRVEHLVTPFVRSKANLAFWNEIATRTSPDLAIDSHDPQFRGELYRWALGDIMLLWPRAGSSIVHRRLSNDREDRVLVHIQGEGSCRQEHAGQDIALRRGEMSLCVTSSPTRITIDTHDMFVIDIPRHYFAGASTILNGCTGTRFSAHSASLSAFRQFLTTVWREAIRSEQYCDIASQDELRNVIVAMLKLVLRGGRQYEVRATDRFQWLAQKIDERLCDPSLSGAQLASELDLSVRTLQNAFATINTTPSRYIFKRRMALAAERLRESPHETISSIAFEVGFSDSSYFSRCFQKEFGCCPKKWRGESSSQ